MNEVLQALKSPRVARGVLLFLAAFGGIAAWLPWTSEGTTPPYWASALGLDHPFSSFPFLAACGLLFLNTLACTWARSSRTMALWRGNLPGDSLQLVGQEELWKSFLRGRGFRERRGRFYRYRPALWGGWVLHVGLLILMVGVVAQQGFHDGGAFEVSQGETVRLSAAGTVFSRRHGPLAHAEPPDVEVQLLNFDPFLKQTSYARDSRSRVRIGRVGAGAAIRILDRTRGAHAAGLTLYQAIPWGLALNIMIPGVGVRSLHLDKVSEHRASRRVNDPVGAPATFVVDSKRGLNDPMGTGFLSIALATPGETRSLEIGEPFRFGDTISRVVSVTWWTGLTYEVSPGMPAVFVGFAVVLLGSALLTFPAGVASAAGNIGVDGCRVFMVRGGSVLANDWEVWRGQEGERTTGHMADDERGY